VAQHVDIGDRLTTVGEHHRDISQHPATIVDRHERAAAHRCRQRLRQAGPVGQQPQPDAARVSHHA
jgi:hypothetical protein